LKTVRFHILEKLFTVAMKSANAPLAQEFKLTIHPNFINDFALCFPRAKTQSVNKLWVTIHCRMRKKCYAHFSSLKEPERAKLDERKAAQVPGIIPGDWGKVGPGWLAQLLLSEAARQNGGGRIHQFLWRCSRIVSKREKGTERRGAIRNRSQPGQVTRAGFEPE
jgi:hypothetical protein